MIAYTQSLNVVFLNILNFFHETFFLKWVFYLITYYRLVSICFKCERSTIVCSKKYMYRDVTGIIIY